MRTSFTLAASAFALLSTVTASINSPTALTECVPALISWTETTSPYYLNIIQDADSANIVENIGTFTGTNHTWTVDIASGTNVSLALTDSLGVTYYSGSVIIQAGSSTSCVGENTATTESSDSSSTTAASGSSASSSSSSKAASSSSKASSSTTATGSAASSSSTSTTTSGATSLGFSGVAALLVVVRVAFSF